MTWQKFDVTASPEQGPPRLAQLRSEMTQAGLDAWLVPRGDRFGGEFIADGDARLEWLTGFTGSAGICAVLQDCAGLFVDGRYRVQARQQVAADFTLMDRSRSPVAVWLADHMPENTRAGFDPWLHTQQEYDRLNAILSAKSIELVRHHNLIDRIWHDRPPPPESPARVHLPELAGQSSIEKRKECTKALQLDGHDAAFLAQPESVCWLLNLRGGDVPRVPVLHCQALLLANAEVRLFTNPQKLAGIALDSGITVYSWQEQEGQLAALGRDGACVRLDSASTPMAIHDMLKAHSARLVDGEDPCLLPKACKNATEIAGARVAHQHDAVAMCRFLAWLEQAHADSDLSEIEVARQLEAIRRCHPTLHDISFDTICGSGPNGAIVHYRVTEDSNRTIGRNDILLIDSGGQYLEGTTDITRTVALGQPDPVAIDAFTRVLKGMISLSRLRFPEGTTGGALDAIARVHLWHKGMDYGHGTGHGVGNHLSVHEGPQRLSAKSNVALRSGMILSNEPGFYHEGVFGIRIENLLVIQECPDLPDYLEFETLAFVPIDRRLIDVTMLDAEERTWIDCYHAKCRDGVAPSLEGSAAEWLIRATAPLA